MSFRPRSRSGFRPNRPQHRSQQQRRFMPPKANIHHSRYVNKAVAPAQEQAVEITHTFKEFGLDRDLLDNVLSHGYSTPTPIQDQAIPVLMRGQDVVGIANTGTGKTAAFLLPLIHKVLRDPNQGVLILAPTRELALQIMEEYRAFAKDLDLDATLCIGGTNMRSQLQRLSRNPHFVIGTPGRIKDVMNRGAFNIEMFTNVVLDEVDRMLDIGFRKEIEFLISKLPVKRHAAFFSATVDHNTEDIMKKLLTNPVKISVKKTETNDHIEQDIVRVLPHETKIDVLHKMLNKKDFSKVIVFGRTKHGINKIERQLTERGIKVSSIHGNKSQGARQNSLKAFKLGQVQALLATDIAARGIDIDDVTHVINYDEPMTYEDYVHRIGRTGRAGKVGKALTFVQ